ncbi:DUF262 domain-containing protein [Streptomyces albidoflavus]
MTSDPRSSSPAHPTETAPATSDPSTAFSGHGPNSPQQTDPAVEFNDIGRSTGVETESIGEREGSPFDPDQIEVQPRNPTVSLLLERLHRGSLDLTPDFQRRSGIWKQREQSRLIESLLLRIALPTLYAAEEDDDSWVVVDGVQRLTAIARFVAPDAIDAEPLRLKDLEYLGEFNERTFKELPGRFQTRILETELTTLLIRRGTPEEAKFNIFARINTNGLPLSRQELRHALIPGRAREFIAELASSPEFIDATDGSISPDRMSDREMCLRFLAFTMTTPESYLAQDFDYFLRETMHRLNTLSQDEIADLREKFSLGMTASRAVFGPNAFRKQYTISTSRRTPVNKALFESQAVLLSRLSPHEISTLVTHADDVNRKFQTLMDEDPTYFDSISSGTGDANKVNYRFQSLKEIFREVLGA